MNLLGKILLPLALLAPSLSRADSGGARPTQFVLISFDNCQELQTWKQVSSLFDQLNAPASGSQAHFTFFLSGAGLLSGKERGLYQNPSPLAASNPAIFPEIARRELRGRTFSATGESNIGFGGDDLTISQRVDFVNRMHRQGNEVGSHAVGHFDGTLWTEEMWKLELDQFDAIVDRLAGPGPGSRLALTSKDIYSFRAPYLGGNAGMVKVLSEKGFTADSSDINENFHGAHWPVRYSVNGQGQGPWDFGLTWTDAENRFSSAENPALEHLPAMDYNYCVHQTDDRCGASATAPSTPDAVTDAQNMLGAYMGAFVRSYNGNRAPIVIGHHFFPYRGGVYNAALAKFARKVCQQAETKCVTFQELAHYMDQLSPADRARFEKGSFPKATYQPTPAQLLQGIL